MSNTLITARINDQTLQLINIPLLASGSEGVLQIRCEFDASWDGYGKAGVFYRSEAEVYHVPLVEGVATVPAEVLVDEGFFFFGIMGTAENTRTTEVLRISVVKGAITVATATPAEPTPDIYRQLLTAYGVMSSRVDELVAMRSAGGAGSYNLSDEYISGTIKTNGASALIDFTIAELSLVAGGYHYTDYCIMPELAPLGPVYLETSNPDINVTMEPANIKGWARLLIENVGASTYTTDMVTTAKAYYPLASVSISELADVRVDVDGETHSTAGAAVRSQVRGLRNDAAPVIINTEVGNYITAPDAAEGRTIQNLRVFGKTRTVKGGLDYFAPPKPTIPVSLQYPSNVEILVYRTNTGDLGLLEPLATFNYPMAGIPTQDASTRHNYTDAKGQKWFTDEIDLERGVYIQRCFTLTFDGTEPWFSESSGYPRLASFDYPGLSNFETGTGAPDNGYCAYHICSHFQSNPRVYTPVNKTVDSFGGSRGYTLQFVWDDYKNDLEGWKQWLADQAAAGTPVTMVLGRITPVEQKFTTIQLPVFGPDYFAENDASLNMELRYFADTKTYIDMKLAAISAAMLNN